MSADSLQSLPVATSPLSPLSSIDLMLSPEVTMRPQSAEVGEEVEAGVSGAPPIETPRTGMIENQHNLIYVTYVYSLF